MDDVKEINGEQFLERIEELYDEEGMEAIVDLVKEEFAVGTLVDLKRDPADITLHRICNRAIWELDSQGTLTESAILPPYDVDDESCGVIRVFALTYVSEPFQIELYGKEVRE